MLASGEVTLPERGYGLATGKAAQNPGTTLGQAQAVLARRKEELKSLPFVEMVGTTVIEGEPAILVMMSRRPEPEEWLPTYLDGVRVVARVTGKIQAL